MLLIYVSLCQSYLLFDQSMNGHLKVGLCFHFNNCMSITTCWIWAYFRNYSSFVSTIHSPPHPQMTFIKPCELSSKYIWLHWIISILSATTWSNRLPSLGSYQSCKSSFFSPWLPQKIDNFMTWFIYASLLFCILSK